MSEQQTAPLSQAEAEFFARLWQQLGRAWLKEQAKYEWCEYPDKTPPADAMTPAK